MQPTGKDYLLITAAGDDQVGLVEAFTAKIHETGCNIESSRMAALAGQFAMLVLVSGPWNALVKLENQLEPLARQLGLTLIHRRTRDKPREGPTLPYRVDVVALDHPGIVHNLASFFARNGINIEELSTETYPAPHTGTPMFAVHMEVSVPAAAHIPTLRGDFFDYCDDLNLDATFEPSRG